MRPNSITFFVMPLMTKFWCFKALVSAVCVSFSQLCFANVLMIFKSFHLAMLHNSAVLAADAPALQAVTIWPDCKFPYQRSLEKLVFLRRQLKTPRAANCFLIKHSVQYHSVIRISLQFTEVNLWLMSDSYCVRIEALTESWRHMLNDCSCWTRQTLSQKLKMPKTFTNWTTTGLCINTSCFTTNYVFLSFL